MRNDIIIRPETHKDYKQIISLILRSFSEGTDYSDGTDIIALVEEIRDSKYYIPELSFVAEIDGRIVGYFMFSRFPLSSTPNGTHIDDEQKKQHRYACTSGCSCRLFSSRNWFCNDYPRD